jgi:hypothetical protein
MKRQILKGRLIVLKNPKTGKVEYFKKSKRGKWFVTNAARTYTGKQVPESLIAKKLMYKERKTLFQMIKKMPKVISKTWSKLSNKSFLEKIKITRYILSESIKNAKGIF